MVRGLRLGHNWGKETDLKQFHTMRHRGGNTQYRPKHEMRCGALLCIWKASHPIATYPKAFHLRTFMAGLIHNSPNQKHHKRLPAGEQVSRFFSGHVSHRDGHVTPSERNNTEEFILCNPIYVMQFNIGWRPLQRGLRNFLEL